MPNLRDIRKRIEASISISKITMTMEKIATVRMTRMIQRMESSKAYNATLLDMAEDLFLAALKEDNAQGFCILTRKKHLEKAGIIYLASNQGLCAGFNVALGHELARLEEKLQKANIKPLYYPAGKKAVQQLNRRKLPIEYSLVNLSDQFKYEEIQSLGNRLVQDVNLGKIDDLYLIYTHYVASATYKVITEPLSPCKGFSPKGSKKVPPLICHPVIPDLIKAFLPEIIINRIYKAMLESMVCEQIARRMAMKQATDAAEDKIDELRSLYHTTRQAKITKEVNEMMGTVLALQRD